MMRQSHSDSHTTGGLWRCRNAHSDCVVLIAEFREGPYLVARQVIEGLQYSKKNKRIDITLILELENPNTVPTCVRVAHRGDVDGWLEPFTFGTEDRALRLLTSLYSNRIVRNPGNPRNAFFYPRVNCLAVAVQPTVVSLEGPTRCFVDGIGARKLEPEMPKGAHPSFTSFLLPAVAPKAKDLFVLRLRFEGATYEHLLGQQPWFSVSSYRRLLSDIAAFDMVNASPKAQKLFRDSIEPVQAHIVPEAYDVVLFQDIGDPVEVMDGSVCILPVRHEDDQLARQVLWFYGKPASDFYLELRYADSRPAGPPDDCFIVSGSRARQRRLLRKTAI
ncbi:MAG: hypothetical protein NTZ17_00245 [Phycisphaerae bacterium]|nr:hypothetical protein [Phycisphaerae bacterium]